MKLGLIDYGSGNFTSVYNALKIITDDVTIVRQPEGQPECSHYILPGVGAFAACMQKLNDQKLNDFLYEEVIYKKKPFMGICVGMQILSEFGLEFGKTAGLGWLKGEVRKFDFSGFGELTLPHIGWNTIEGFENQRLFKNINAEEPSFYFVHSYHFVPAKNTHLQSTYCNYGYKFIASVEDQNIFGVQFHPEKSQGNGITVLKNFLCLNG